MPSKHCGMPYVQKNMASLDVRAWCGRLLFSSEFRTGSDAMEGARKFYKDITVGDIKVMVCDELFFHFNARLFLYDPRGR